VKSDTLIVFLEPLTAILSQRESEPFTRKDLKLREIVFELYPRIRPTPFPWSFRLEPKFEVAK
jgi:hypothetical protein